MGNPHGSGTRVAHVARPRALPAARARAQPLHFPPWIQYGCIFDFAHWLTRVTSRPISSVRRIHLSILVRPFSYVQPAGRSVSYQGRGRDQTSTMLSDVRSVDGPSLGGNARRRGNKRKRSSEGKKKLGSNAS